MSIVSNVVEGVMKEYMSSYSLEGSILTSILGEIKNGILHDRMDEWKKSVENKLEMLRDIQLDQLSKNQVFANVLFISGQLALKTNKQKIKLLANAVGNTATTDLREERIVILLNCIEKYTISHLRMLFFCQNPRKFISEEPYMGSPITYYHKCFPENNSDLDRIINRDLYLDGMIDTESLSVTVTGKGCLEKRTTALGDDMISFFGIEMDNIT